MPPQTKTVEYKQKSKSITGTHINYLFICQTKLWLFSRHLHMEHNSELVETGRFIHENAYQREKKEIRIDGISIDFIKKGETIELHEIKKSQKMETAHEMQALYYLYVLKNKGISAEAVIDYPLIRQRKHLKLGEAEEVAVKNAVEEASRVISGKSIPQIERKKFCSKCSYYELCWSE